MGGFSDFVGIGVGYNQDRKSQREHRALMDGRRAHANMLAQKYAARIQGMKISDPEKQALNQQLLGFAQPGRMIHTFDQAAEKMIGGAEAAAIAAEDAKQQELARRYNMGASGLTPPELFAESERMLARDRGRFAGAPRPQYNGPMAAPMSALTQQAQNLRSQYASRPQPYEGKINTLLTRQPQGLDVNRLLNPQLAEQEQYGRNNLMETMRAQLGHATPQMDPFMANLARSRGEVGDVARGELGHLSNVAKELERKHNTAAVEGLRGLQSNVQARREAQIGTMNQMGNQKHAHGNMMLGGQRAQFEEEANAPYTRMDKLGHFLKQNAQNFGEDVHPDLQKPLSRELLQAMSAYGVDTSKPVSEWDNKNVRDTVYRGPRTASLPPEVLASHNMMMGVTPRQEGPASDERRRLVAELMSPESISEKAMQNIPEHIRPRIADLRRTAQRTFGSNIAEINNRYIQANQPFSLQNTNAVQARGEEVARRLAQEEADILRQGTATQVGLSHDQALNSLRRLGEVGDQEQGQFRNTMKMVTDLNKQGTDKWRNQQNELEDIFQNYQQSSPWGFSPQMRQEAMNMGMQKGADEMRSQLNNPAYVQSLQLGNPQLELYGQRYDALNKERNSAAEQQRIANEQQARQALEAQLHAQQVAYQQQQQQYQQQLAAQQAQGQQAAQAQAQIKAQQEAQARQQEQLAVRRGQWDQSENQRLAQEKRDWWNGLGGGLVGAQSIIAHELGFAPVPKNKAHVYMPRIEQMLADPNVRSIVGTQRPWNFQPRPFPG